MAELAVLGTIFSAVSSVVGGIASMQASQAQAAQMELQAQAQERQARILEDNAARAQVKAATDAQENDWQTAAFLGQQLSDQSASGVDIGFGSTKYTRIATREIGRQDTLNIRQAGDLDAYNYKVQSEDARIGAVSSRMQASAARQAGQFSLLGGILGAGSVIGKSQNPAARTYGFTPPVRPQVLS